MKFLHVADLHIGSTRTLPGDFERQESVYNQIFEAAQEHEVDAVVVAGDIWQTGKKNRISFSTSPYP